MDTNYEYIAVGYHPTDVIVLSIGHYAEVMSFNDYEYQLSKLDKEGPSST